MLAMLVDVTKCIGCERCVKACVEANSLDSVKAGMDRATTSDGLSAHRLCTILPMADGRFARKSCMHCLEPSCVAACLVGAIEKIPEGPVVYDPDKCIGCRYCMLACPFHIPRYEWDKTAPFVRKCTMCMDRVAQGKLPACVEACDREALAFGERAALLRRAHEMIRAHPNQYLPRVWGEHEFGGTSVLYISDVDLAALGWAGTENVGIPELTRPLISKTPFIGFSVCFGAWALSAIIERRNRLMRRDSTTDRDSGSEPEEEQDGG